VIVPVIASGLSVTLTTTNEAIVLAVGLLAVSMVYEGAHVVGAVAVGGHVSSVRVGPLAGRVYYSGGQHPQDRVIIAVAAPVATGIVAVTAGTLSLYASDWSRVMIGIAGVALADVVGNLVPVAGTDGRIIAQAIQKQRRK